VQALVLFGVHSTQCSDPLQYMVGFVLHTVPTIAFRSTHWFPLHVAI
jgi:hypothetical protein